MLRKELIRYIRTISKDYGVKVSFIKYSFGGYYDRGRIFIGKDLPKFELIDTFCHELGHFLNDKEGKYKLYHRFDGKHGINKLGVKRYAQYALKAEVYTEKRAKLLAKKWFPKHKFKASYKNTEFWRGFFYGYYFESF